MNYLDAFFQLTKSETENRFSKMVILHVYESIELEKTLIKSADDSILEQNMGNAVSLVEGIDIEFCFILVA